MLGCNLTNAQISNGPGGVSTIHLNMWFDAGRDAYSDEGLTMAEGGDFITRWGDLSSSSTTSYASQANAAMKPLYSEAVFNGQPAVSFDGTNDLLLFDVATYGSGSYFVVFFSSYLGGAFEDQVLNISGGGQAFVLEMDGNLSFSARYFDGTNNHLLNTNVQPRGGIITVDYLGSSPSVLYEGGRAEDTQTLGAASSWTDGVGAIGGHSISEGYFRGDISEILHFSSPVNEVEKLLVENYLSAKYDLPLYENNLYTRDNLGYDFDVAGIGRIGSDQLLDAMGTGMVRMFNPSDLNDGEFLIWGHNGLKAEAVNATDVPSGVAARFERIWSVSEKNTSSTQIDVGSVDLQWDLSGLGPVDPDDLRLIVDSDKDGQFADETPIAGAVFDAISGYYTFFSVTALVNNSEFTIGTANAGETPLPVELYGFDVIKESNDVRIVWQTFSELNNDYFEVYRSKDGDRWSRVTRVDGMGTTNVPQQYQVSDISTVSGTHYYKLKQVDFDGQVKWSEVLRVQFRQRIADLIAWPNPVTDLLNLKPVILSSSFFLYDLTGTLVREWSIDDYPSTMPVVDVSSVPSGVYLLKHAGETLKVVKQ
ncbi:MULTISPECIES: T9SS type A sorting domain-containing protein [Reichenbachiella]|uniref:T9SS type A sorting domain-containing protein n=1 Tax=Reichenbachiella TaxID=156993 RepID=UPI0011C43726|nr:MULTISPECIES: T9SS type A sorting domain-containing protein [Reichenbachiella]MBU2912757.1 T9SS type A sorting domain-containing protein [Reichenbachiella agariperforans]